MKQMEKKDSKPKLFIVDDILGNIKLLIEILKPIYEISFVTDSAKALDSALVEEPDLILLDIMMPGIDGFEVCKRFKAEPALAEIPVIFLTALEESESVVRGFDLGAVDYITKPYYPAELKTRIETHLKLKKSREIIERQNRELAELFQIFCHDFLTPISFAIGSLELIKENRNLFDTFGPDILKSLNSAVDLIELVRTLRKTDDLNETLQIGPIKLGASLKKALVLLQPNLRRKNINLQTSVADDHVILAEETSLINSVINNLLTNAVKFSYADSVVAASSFEESDRIILEIRDYGIGMSEAVQRDLFVIKRTTSRKGTAGEAGTGYGMLLIKKFVDLYGAELTVNSNSITTHPENHGTTVRISFLKA